MDNFNMPNNGDQYMPDHRADSSSPDASYQSGSPASGEYSIKYQPGTNVFRASEPQYQSAPYSSGNYQTQSYGSSYQSQYSQPVYQTAASSGGSSSSGGKAVKTALIAVAVVAIVALGIFAGIWLANNVLADRSADAQTSEPTVSLEVTESPQTNVDYIPSSGEKLTYAQIAAKFRSAVVSVTVYYNAYGWASYVYSEGSGFIIDEEGYIVTNSHVIDDDNYSQFDITVTIAGADGEMTEVEAVVIGNDSRTDLAVLKIDPTGLDLVVSELGQSAPLVLGDEVVAIGNPGGAQFAGSITNGIISGIDRIIDDSSGTSDSAMKYLQTNAAINPGNSGGPLLNMYGQVIGINTAKIVDEGYESLGFAIPIDTALPIIQQLIEEGSVVRPALGVSCSEITAQTAQWYDVPQGLLVRGFYSNSTLPAAGIEVGDIIVACDGAETLTLTDLQNAIEAKEVGDTIVLTVFRSGNENTFEFKVTLIADNNTGMLLPSGHGNP